MAHLRIVTDSGVVTLADNRDTICLLGKNSNPAGTLFTAVGAGGTTYAFGKPQGASDYGLVLRSETGEVLFDAVSYGRMAKPVGVMAGSIQSTETQTVTQNFPAGRTYAVWIVSPVSSIRVRSGSGTIGGVINYWYYLDDQDMSVTINGGTVAITATRILSTSPNGPTNAGAYEEAAKYDWTALVLDVTGY